MTRTSPAIVKDELIYNIGHVHFWKLSVRKTTGKKANLDNIKVSAEMRGASLFTNVVHELEAMGFKVVTLASSEAKPGEPKTARVSLKG